MLLLTDFIVKIEILIHIYVASPRFLPLFHRLAQVSGTIHLWEEIRLRSMSLRSNRIDWKSTQDPSADRVETLTFQLKDEGRL